jgi:hypothetical protein
MTGDVFFEFLAQSSVPTISGIMTSLTKSGTYFKAFSILWLHFLLPKHYTLAGADSS